MECSVDERALENLLRFIDDVSVDGLAACLHPRRVKDYSIAESLSLLAAHGMGNVVTELLGRKMLEIFIQSSFSEYISCICGSSSGADKADADEGCGGCSTPAVAAALVALNTEYTRMMGVLRECGTLLRSTDHIVLFTTGIRCALLQHDPLTGEGPPGKRELFRFLRCRGEEILSRIENGRVPGGRALGCCGVRDEVICALQNLTLSATPEIKLLWKSVLAECVKAKVGDAGEDFSKGCVRDLVLWKEQVIDAFVRLTITPETTRLEARSENDRWCEELEQLLLATFGRKLMRSFWDLVVEYPDSIPALEDLQFCLMRCANNELRDELVALAKQMLGSRLHRAGTRTEDILAILVGTIHSLSVLLSKNEQNSVILAIVGDTLHHLQKRKDSISVVVHALTQPSADSVLYADLQSAPPTKFAEDTDDDDAGGGGSGSDEDDGEQMSKGWGRHEPRPRGGSSTSGWKSASAAKPSWTAQRRPDVLRVLLSAITVSAVVEEYRTVLAGQLLLEKPQHDFDTTTQEEVLERLKCILGEDVLSNCAVMVRDLPKSRRINYRIHNEGKTAEAQAMWPMSVDILSATCWPNLASVVNRVESSAGPPPEKYNVHPSLLGAMESFAASYKHIHPDQRLRWYLNCGRVSLDIEQRQGVAGIAQPVTYELPLFSASLVLFLFDSTKKEGRAAATVDELAGALGVAPSVVAASVSVLNPTIVIVGEDGRLFLQELVVTADTHVFNETSTEKEKPCGIGEETLAFLAKMVTAMLKTRGAKSVSEIHNSMKMFGQFQGSPADMKQVLMYFVSEGKLTTTDGALFACPAAT